jgi:hypothetical protein
VGRFVPRKLACVKLGVKEGVASEKIRAIKKKSGLESVAQTCNSTPEVKIRRITVRGQPGQKVHETPDQ